MKQIKVKLTFLEELLGSLPNTETIYRDFIASKAPDAATIEDEVAAVGVDEAAERGITVFPRNAEGQPFLYDYQVKGFFKGACSMLNRLTGKDKDTGKKKTALNESGKLTAFKKIIDGLIFVSPRAIPIEMPAGFDGDLGRCSRPLRAQTAQGERIALAESEAAPAGASVTFTVSCLSDEHEKAVIEWLDYGVFSGIGQWRNSGKGRFSYERLD